MYPFGLNIRLKGLGDFNPSQGDYRPYVFRKRNNRSHGKRKPKSQRPPHNIDIPFLLNFHRTLRNSPRFTHQLKTYLFSIPRIQLLNLNNDLNNFPNIEPIVKDSIKVISTLRLFNPVQITEKIKKTLHVSKVGYKKFRFTRIDVEKIISG